MNNIENFDISLVPVWKIETVVTSEPDYEMNRTMVIEHYPEYGNYTVANGGHCSCYDFDDTKWDATTYTYDEMRLLMEGWINSGWGTEKKVAEIWVENHKRSY